MDETGMAAAKGISAHDQRLYDAVLSVVEQRLAYWSQTGALGVYSQSRQQLGSLAATLTPQNVIPILRKIETDGNCRIVTGDNDRLPLLDRMTLHRTTRPIDPLMQLQGNQPG